MATLSDSTLTLWNNLFQWFAIVGTALGLLSAVGLYFVSSELDRRADLKLEIAQNEIEKLKPLPLKARVTNFLNGIDEAILRKAKDGELVFRLSLNHAQAADLEKLGKEDADGRYLLNIPNTNFIMNQPGMAGEFIVKIGPQLLE